MKFINIGYSNMVAVEKIVSIVGAESAPTKRLVQEARDNHTVIDATYGRKTRSVIIMESGHVVLSSFVTETIVARINGNGDESKNE